jgi:hypothetical protein
MNGTVGFVERMEESKKGQVTEKDFAWGARVFTEALDRRRALVDEMEKLIGVRELGEHPDGIRGGTVALLGITDKLEPTCKARWGAFVVSTLLGYLDKQGTNEEVMARVTAAYSDLTPPIGFMEHKETQGFEDFVIGVLQDKWRDLHTGTVPPASPGTELRVCLSKKVGERYGENYSAEIKQFAYITKTANLLVDLNADGRRSQMSFTLDAQRPMAQASKIAK